MAATEEEDDPPNEPGRRQTQASTANEAGRKRTGPRAITPEL